MLYEPIIGMEVHAELLTASKMFCGCDAHIFGTAPNSRVCPVCLGMPGVLPVINRKAVEYTIMAGLACGGETEIRTAEAVEVTFPAFVDCMTALGANLNVKSEEDEC